MLLVMRSVLRDRDNDRRGDRPSVCASRSRNNTKGDRTPITANNRERSAIGLWSAKRVVLPSANAVLSLLLTRILTSL